MATDAEFLNYYLKEINYLRVAGSEFSRTYRDLAGGLDFESAETDDPQIARLIESFAFLTAKLQQQYDAQFPEIPTALLESLYPQLVAPVPPMAIAQFAVSPKQDRAIEGITVPRETSLFATTTGGAECRFRTGFALPLWPIEVVAARMQEPGELDFLDDRPKVQACLRVTLRCLSENRSFAALAPRALRFFLDGERGSRFRLFELLRNNLSGVAVVTRDGDREVAAFPPSLRIEPAGLEADEAMLPYPEGSHHGYRLLQEYFNFPDKFLFVELAGLAPGMLGEARDVDLLFLFDSDPPERLIVDASAMRLNCVPVINLFHQTSEPIRLDHISVDYLLEPDIRAADTTEIHSVLGITRSVAGGDADDVPPYFSGEPDSPDGGRLRWIARRLPASNPMIGGSEVQLSFVDPAMNPLIPAEDVLFAQLLCTNRGLARQVSKATRFQVEADLPIDRISCLARPTPPAEAPVKGESLWRLVSHLSHNKLALDRHGGNLEALRQILFLYSGTDESSRKRRQIEGIESIATRPIVRRLGDRQWRGFVRGTEITIVFDEEHFVGASAFLLGSVLDRFFALYAGVNSFTELVIRRAHQEEDWKRWPPRAGDRPLL